MGTISDKLTYLNTTKTMLRDSLNKYGSNILTTDTFRSYDTKLNDIYDKLPKVTQSGAGFTLSNVQNGLVDDFKLIGVDLSQSGTPAPENPQQIKVVEGRQIINISDGTNSVNYNIDLNLENIYLAKMPNTNYKNKIYKNNGNWYYEKNIEKVILDGSINTFVVKTNQQGNCYAYDTNFQQTASLDDVPKLICNKFLPKSWNDRNNYLDGAIIFTYSNNNRLNFRFGTSSEITTLEQANAYLQQNPVELWGILATPVTTQITNTTLISQLEAISTFKGTNIITISNDNNIIPEIEITRLKELEKLA